MSIESAIEDVMRRVMREFLQLPHAAMQRGCCIFCGWHGTPMQDGEASAEEIRSHFITCEKHPIREIERERNILRTKLEMAEKRLAHARSKRNGKPAKVAGVVELPCSFCAKTQREVGKLIAGPGTVYICDECVALCSEIIAEPPKPKTAEEEP